MSLPKSFDEFKKINYIRIHNEEKKQLVRFVYRYRLAKCFDSTNAAGVGRTLKSYDSILKVFLAYTAYEQLMKVAPRLGVFKVFPIEINQIIEKEQAENIRSQNAILSFLVKNSQKKELSLKIINFQKGLTDDIACVAYALRNVYAHGELTPTAIGIRNSKDQKILIDLADSILEYCDELFSISIEKLR